MVRRRSTVRFRKGAPGQRLAGVQNRRPLCSEGQTGGSFAVNRRLGPPREKVCGSVSWLSEVRPRVPDLVRAAADRPGQSQGHGRFPGGLVPSYRKEHPDTFELAPTLWLYLARFLC